MLPEMGVRMPQSISPPLNTNLSRPVRFPHASSIRKIAVWQLLVDRMPHAKSVDAHLSRACVPTPFSRFPCPQERASPVRSTRAAPEPPGSPGVGGSEVRGFSVKGPAARSLRRLCSRFVPDGSSTPWSTSCGSAAGTSRPQTYASCRPARSNSSCWTFSSLSRTEGQRGLCRLQDTLHHQRRNFDM